MKSSSKKVSAILIFLIAFSLFCVVVPQLFIHEVKENPSSSPPLVLQDDDLTTYFTEAKGAGSGTWRVIISVDSSEVYSGLNSLKMNVTSGGTYIQPWLRHTYSLAQNFSMFTGVYFYFYGLNTGKRLSMTLEDTQFVPKTYDFTDNFNGWTLQNATFADMSGTADISVIRKVYFYFPFDYGDKVWYFDQIGLWGGPTSGEPPSTGDWFPVGQTIENQNLLLNGSILLINNTFTVKNSIIRFNLEATGAFGIKQAFEGGNFQINFDNVTLKSENPSFRYSFVIDTSSRLYINGSTIYNATKIDIKGFGQIENTEIMYGDVGIQINYGEVNNVTIGYVGQGIYVPPGGQAVIIDSVIVHDVMIGFHFRGSYNEVKNSVVFNFVSYAVNMAEGAHHNIAQNVTSYSGHEAFRSGGISAPHNNQYIDCRAWDVDWAFVIQNSAYNETIMGGEAYDCVYQGITVENPNPQNTWIEGVAIHDTPTGIVVRNSAVNTTLKDLVFYNNKVYDINWYNNATGTIIDIATQSITIQHNANLTHKWTVSGFGDGYISLFKNSTNNNKNAYVTSSSFSTNKLTFTVSAPSGTTSIKVYSANRGRPTYIANITSPVWSYDSTSQITTLNISHFSVESPIISWENFGGIYFTSITGKLVSVTYEEFQMTVSTVGTVTINIYCPNLYRPFAVSGASNWTFDSSSRILSIVSTGDATLKAKFVESDAEISSLTWDGEKLSIGFANTGTFTLKVPGSIYVKGVTYNKLPLLMNEFTFFVAPSRTEAQGVSMCEAMACGLPVVATNVGGIPEFVINEYNGLLG